MCISVFPLAQKKSVKCRWFAEMARTYPREAPLRCCSIFVPSYPVVSPRSTG